MIANERTKQSIKDAYVVKTATKMKYLIITEAEPLLSFNRVRNLIFITTKGTIAIWNDSIKVEFIKALNELNIPFEDLGNEIKLTGDYHCICNIDIANKYNEICIVKGCTTCKEVTSEQFINFMAEANNL